MSKILTLDIERLIGKFEGEFWDPNDMKNRRIPPDWVVRSPRTICFAWKWEDERTVGFVSEWDDGAEGMAQKAYELYCEADVVQGHNIKGFDSPHLQALANEHGLVLPPVQHLDTLTIARKHFNFEHNNLDVLCRRFGIKGKVDKYDPEVAKRAVLDDHGPSQRRITRYNKGDVYPASEGLARYFRPYSGINFAALDAVGGLVCPLCKSTRMQKRGTAVTKAGYRYPRYQCQECGAWSQERKNDKSELNEVKPA